MVLNYKSDSTYCSSLESDDKRSSKVKKKFDSAILEGICKKIENHVAKKQLLNPFEVVKCKQKISKLRLNSYKLKFRAERIRSYLNGIYQQSKSMEDTIPPKILLGNGYGDPLSDCGISQDLIMLYGCKNYSNPIGRPAQVNNQSLSFDTDMLSNQMFINISQNYENTCLTPVVNRKSSNSIPFNFYNPSQSSDLNAGQSNINIIETMNCTEIVQKDQDKSDSNPRIITNFNESTMLKNNTISDESIMFMDNTITEINKNIVLIPTNCSEASFNSDMLSNQHFLTGSTKSSKKQSSIPKHKNIVNLPLISEDLFSQKEINLKATEVESKTINPTETLEYNWSPTEVIRQLDTHSLNNSSNESRKKKYSHKRLFNETNTSETMSIDDMDESLNVISSIDSNCDKINIESNACSNVSMYYINKETDISPDEINFKKPTFIYKTKPKICSDIQDLTLKKSEKNHINNFKPLNECGEFCNITKKFLNIVEATDDDTKKTIEVLKNLSDPSSKKEFHAVSQIGIFCLESFNKTINNLFYNIGSGSENWEGAVEKIDETNYLHEEISDWLGDILANISDEDKAKTDEAFKDLENQVANCLDPEVVLDLDISSLFRSNYRRLKEIKNEFNRKLIREDFKSTIKNEERCEDPNGFDWKQFL